MTKQEHGIIVQATWESHSRKYIYHRESCEYKKEDTH